MKNSSHLLGRNDWSISNQGKVDSGIRNQIGLELIQINVESSVKSERGCDGGNNLGDQTVQVGVGRTFNVEVSSADVVDGLVVDHEGAVGVFQGGVGGQDCIVRFNNSSGHLGSGVDGELKFRFLSIINRKTLHK